MYIYLYLYLYIYIYIYMYMSVAFRVPGVGNKDCVIDGYCANIFTHRHT